MLTRSISSQQTQLMPAKKIDDHANLRPARLSEYVGQESIKNHLAMTMEAAKRRNETTDHVLLYGPPGLGKTTLAAIIAEEMKTPEICEQERQTGKKVEMLRIISAPALKQYADIAVFLTELKPGQILFIDEIHRLSTRDEEKLYAVLEDFKVDVTIASGAQTRQVRLQLPPFTLVGATTTEGLLTGPLRDRFGLVYRMEYYTAEELAKIAARSATIMKVDAEQDGLEEIAKRSRGTPRVANNLLKRARDFAQVKTNNGKITQQIAAAALDEIGIDHAGLNKIDRLILETIIHQYKGGPIGVEALASATSEDIKTIIEVYEPYLTQIGFMARTKRGRIATPLAYHHFGLVQLEEM